MYSKEIVFHLNTSPASINEKDTVERKKKK